MLAPWRPALARALHRNRALANSRYAQLATVSVEGRPANRTIVFRGFSEDKSAEDKSAELTAAELTAAKNSLKFISDQRSEKVPQLQQNPWAELCWYFPKTREQFRILGQVQIVDAQTADRRQADRHHTWHNLSDAARSQFAWPNPGSDRVTAGFETAPPDPLTPLPDFCLLLLDPVQVDHLELRGAPQNRYLYTLAEGKWSVREVNP
jgi:pyridoxamine 5'-phosphate oxidase